MRNWVEALKGYNEGKEHKSPAENDREADIEFLKLLEEERKIEEEKDPSYKTIPRFFFKKPNNENSLYFRVRQEARTRFLQNKTSEVLDKEDLEQLWFLLKEYVSLPDDGTERINYD
jgi:serine/threonine-protein phosphatase 2A regulatory subunit B''